MTWHDCQISMLRCGNQLIRFHHIMILSEQWRCPNLLIQQLLFLSRTVITGNSQILSSVKSHLLQRGLNVFRAQLYVVHIAK